MATKNMIKFFKGASAPAAPAAGMIWFCTEDRTIRVYTGSAWEKYAGLVDASWNGTDKTLTITNAAGSTTTLDLSDCASAKDMTAKLQTINNTLDSHNTRINTAQAAAEGAQSHSEGVAGNLATEVQDRKDEIARVEGLVSAEATTARAAEAANAAAAQAADAKAAAAKTYAEGVNTALGNEVTRATEKEAELAGLISAMDSAYKAADEEILGQIEEIVAGAISVEGVSGDKYVEVSHEGTKYIVKSKGVDDAIANAVAVEEGRAEAAESNLSNRIDALAAAETGRVSILESQVAALNAATHFEGKVEGESFDAAIAAAGKTYQAGDIVIYGNKEFIYDGEAWIELGDTTAESGRISQLESWKTTAAQNIADNAANIASNDTDILNLQNEVSGIKNTMATDGELEGVRSDLQGKLDTANASIENHGGRIEALESTANALGTTYVKVSDYNTYKGDVSSRFDGVEGRVGDLEGFQATTEAALEAIATAQGQQDEAIEAAAALGQQGINNAASALAEAQAKVASVTSDRKSVV